MKLRRRHKIATAGVGLLAALVLAAFYFPQQILCVDSGPVKADVIVVLGGGIGERAPRAVELFKEGAASVVVLSGEGDTGANRQALVAGGVPPEAIEIEGKSRSTWENAHFCAPVLKALGARRVVLVTSWYHSRRALKCFQKAAPDIAFYSRPAYGGYDRDDWARYGTWRYVRAEYFKLAGYWVVWRISPF